MLGRIKEKIFYKVLIWSLKKAAREQKLNGLSDKLRMLAPDIQDQYSMFKVNSLYLETKVRNLHAFQISLAKKVIEDFQKPVIVDIGDSSGTHLKYIIGLYSKDKDIKCLSVNMDSKAVDRIRQKGLDVVHARAEDLQSYNIETDIFLCFEMLEHLMNPCYFLHNLSLKTNAKYMVVTVPYLEKSRMGLHHIRWERDNNVCAENTHIFELNPQDWKLLIKHSGWTVVEEKIYFQYPKNGFLSLAKSFWKKCDFEGFYGLILKRDNTWSSRYMDW